MSETIDILLATYNSERFLGEQLDSLLVQTDRNWRLLVRDAGSTDLTLAIVDEYAKRDKRICLVGEGTAKSCENFAMLLSCSTAPYVMFCDHDDVWLPEKIAQARRAMRELETVAGGNQIPLMVFSDAVVTDEKLEVTNQSSFACQHLNPSRIALRQLLFQNVAAGNTMLFNRALALAAGPIPGEAVMHDHWMMLVAALLGKIKLITGEPQILYRQHGGNVLGASSFSFASLLRRVVLKRRTIRARLRAVMAQACALAARYADAENVTNEDRALLRDVSVLPQSSFFVRRFILMRHGIRKNGFLRNLGMLIFA